MGFRLIVCILESPLNLVFPPLFHRSIWGWVWVCVWEGRDGTEWFFWVGLLASWVIGDVLARWPPRVCPKSIAAGFRNAEAGSLERLRCNWCLLLRSRPVCHHIQHWFQEWEHYKSQLISGLWNKYWPFPAFWQKRARIGCWIVPIFGDKRHRTCPWGSGTASKARNWPYHSAPPQRYAQLALRGNFYVGKGSFSLCKCAKDWPQWVSWEVDKWKGGDLLRI